MFVFGIFKTKQFYICSLINIILIFLTSLILSFSINKCNYVKDVLDNCTAKYATLDELPTEENSFIYFDSNVDIRINKDKRNSINAAIVQFMPNMEYNNDSILNTNQVVKGDFAVLKKNEIAISNYLANKFDLDINDVVYNDDSEECVIKFIYKDLLQIVDFDFESSKRSIFVGTNTFNINRAKSYINFTPNNSGHIEIIDYAKIYKDFNSKTILYSFLAAGISIFVLFILFLIRCGSEEDTLSDMCLSGITGQILFVILIELFYLGIPLALLYGLFMLFHIPSILLCFIIGAFCLEFIIDFLILIVRREF